MPMKIRLFNCLVLTMESNEKGELISPFKGEVWTEDELILRVINLENSPEDIPYDNESFSRQIDLKGNLVMPGFKDAHTHSPMTFLRSMADDLPLSDWLNKIIFPMESHLSPEDVYYFTKIAVMEYLSSGITSVFDMYFYQEHVARAFTDCGMRAVLASPLNNFTENPQIMADNYVKFNNYNPLISYRLGFHAQYTTSNDYIMETGRIAKEFKAPVYCHNSETKSEVLECIEANKVTPTRLMENMGLFEYGGGGFHCNYLNEDDINIFKSRSLSIVSNPASNAKLASGIAPLKQYLDESINLALGTDGAASNNALDMFREMYLAAVLAKLRQEDACAIDATSILRMATLGGAKAMRLKDCDYIMAGQLADITVINLNQPNMQPVNNIIKGLVYCAGKNNVFLTMINGRILYEDGDFYLDDTPEYIYKMANTSLNNIKSRG